MAMMRLSGAINNILTTSVQVTRQFLYIELFSSFLRIHSSYSGTLDLPDGEGIITYENVSFSYPGSDMFALKDVNVTVKLNEKISIVGRNGAGKTTFIALLMGLYRPTSGAIYYNNVNIEEIKPDAYQGLFAPVMQDYMVYNFRILDNLRFSNDIATNKQLEQSIQVLKDMNLWDKVQTLPENIETYITQDFSDKGIELSGGESQKLAIARALYKQAPFIIFDEPTSSLSPKSEYEIYKDFANISKNKTVLYISHRLSSTALSDRILVFDESRIVEDGSHSMLMNLEGVYANMYQHQTQLYDIDEK